MSVLQDGGRTSVSTAVVAIDAAEEYNGRTRSFRIDTKLAGNMHFLPETTKRQDRISETSDYHKPEERAWLDINLVAFGSLPPRTICIGSLPPALRTGNVPKQQNDPEASFVHA